MPNWNTPANGYKKDDDPYNLNTPFGSLEKNPFSTPGKEQDNSFGNDPFSGNSKKCPGCGGNLIFDVEIGSLICRSCGNLYNPSTMEMNGSLGIENPEQEYGVNDEIDYQDKGNKEIVCNSCGSQIVTDANTAATICPFCGSPTLVTRRLTRQFRPDALIPFTITKEQAKKAYYDHVTSVRHVPKAFSSKATIDKMTGIYVPFWLVSADVKMDIGGWTHTVMDGSKYYDPLKQEANRNHSVDIPVDGTVEFSLANVPFDGSRKISDRLMEACEPFDLSKLVPYNASYLSGWLAEKYDSQPKDMYERIKNRLDIYCHEVAEKVNFEDTDAFTYNSSYTAIDYKNYRVIYCLLPIWFLNINYNDRRYQYAVNGQTGEVCGVVPYSRVWDAVKSVSEKLVNFKHSAGRSFRNILYAAPAVIIAAMLGIMRMRILSINQMLTAMVILMVLLGIVYVGGMIVPPMILEWEEKHKNNYAIHDPHSLDRRPDVSYYYDSTKKIKVAKKLTKGGENGIIMPRSAMPYKY